jgi:hypothetical protein
MVLTVIGGFLAAWAATSVAAGIALGKAVYRTGTFLDERGLTSVFSDEHIDAAISKLAPMHWREGDRVISRDGGKIVIFVDHTNEEGRFLGEVPGPLWGIFDTADYYLLEMSGVEYSE